MNAASFNRHPTSHPSQQEEDTPNRPPMAASVASAGTSPLTGGYELHQTDSNPDTEESWAFVDVPGSSNPSSIAFFPSPGSGSLASYAVVGPLDPSPPALSPLYLDVDQQQLSGQGSFGAATFGDVATGMPLNVTSMPGDANQLFASGAMSAAGSDAQFVTPQDWMFTEQQLNDLSPFLNNFTGGVVPTGLEGLEQQLQSPELEIPPAMQADPNVSPWDPTGLKQDDGNVFIMEGFTPPPGSSVSVSPPPPSPPIKQEPSSGRAPVPSPIRRVRGAGVRVEKRKPPTSDASSTSSGGSPNSKFVIVTPNSISAHAGKPNPFECFEAMRPSQKGRKGPLANETKESALQVRRLGACFCCHARKVKCDKERPCKSCKKLMVQVPQVVCWQFQDFLTVLFPEFIRGHFKKEEMTKFISENIEGFTVDGVEKPCTVELFSGARFSASLSIRAKFFTAKTADILQHWHLNVGASGVDLQSWGSAPIGLDTEGNSQKDEIKKKVKEYISALIQEPGYAEQVTDSLHTTEVPQRVLQIVQAYAQRSDSPIVKRALSIYAMHYVLTRHLTLTRQSIVNLSATKLVPQNLPWVTPRMLNRQVKAIIDEHMMREMQVIFENFSKQLKPKSRKEWAPCLAAFLVLTLFMESIETAAESFVLSENEVSMRNRFLPPFRREFALNLNKEVENLPFKQFAYQFHQIYQTHSRDASAKSFNPIIDDSLITSGDLDSAAVDMVLMLRQLVLGSSWDELDFLTMDPILSSEGGHPWPMDVAQNYTGRLVSKFLLSFTDEKYIFEPKM